MTGSEPPAPATTLPWDCVVDASAGIKLFLVEAYSGVVDRLFDQLAADPPARFYVPDLFFVECGDAVTACDEKGRTGGPALSVCAPGFLYPAWGV